MTAHAEIASADFEAQRVALMALALDSERAAAEEAPAAGGAHPEADYDFAAIRDTVPVRVAAVARALCVALFLLRRRRDPAQALAAILARRLGENELRLIGDAVAAALDIRAGAGL